MPHTLAGQLSVFICLTVCVYAIRVGRTPERVAATAQGACALCLIFVQDRVHWMDPEHRVLGLDALLLIVLVGLTSATKRRWLIIATAAQILAVSIHFIIFHMHLKSALAYLTVDNALGYLVSAALAVGAWQVAQVRRASRMASADTHKEATNRVA